MRRKDREEVPAEPFARWLNERYEYWEQRCRYIDTSRPGEHPTSRVCQEIGWEGETGVRRLWRYRHRLSETAKGRTRTSRGTRVLLTMQTFPRDVVEDALHHADVMFMELYPDIAAAEELDLEPAQWCPGCREERTPIDGHCPFCEWRVGPSTGQVLRGRKLAA